MISNVKEIPGALFRLILGKLAPSTSPGGTQRLQGLRMARRKDYDLKGIA
jgi:hypothetical protein